MLCLLVTLRGYVFLFLNAMCEGMPEGREKGKWKSSISNFCGLFWTKYALIKNGF